MILTIRTDKPKAEIGLYEGSVQKAYREWQAHKELSVTIHLVTKELLGSAGLNWGDIRGIVYFKGPGSFTGLRIGAAVSNALAVSNSIPLSSQGSENWIEDGIESLCNGEKSIAVPEYGAEPHITAQKK